MKKILKSIVILSLAALVGGCGVSVGNVPDNAGNDKYKELFPDTAANEGSTYAHSNVEYKFSLENYGEMLVNLDTTNGHEFMLVPENSGFNINDKDGNTAIFAACVASDVYEELTANLTEIRTYNGRDFLVRIADDGSIDVLSYMADCGLDCGLLMEVKGDESLFSLLAFRGEPLEGSVSDVNFYKGNAQEFQYDTSDAIVTEAAEPTERDSDSLTNSTLSDELEKKISRLKTDYNIINWGVRYSVSDEIPELVISITPYTEDGMSYLLIGLTNLSSEDLSFSADAKAYDAHENEIGSTFVYEAAIGAGGNTAVTKIDCGENTPDGRISWENIEIKSAEYQKYIPWQIDYDISSSEYENMYKVTYDFYSQRKEDMESAAITGYVVDENGFVLAEITDFMNDSLLAGEKYQGETDLFCDDAVMEKAANVAFFSNPVVTVEE